MPRGVTKCGAYHSIHLRAIPFHGCTTLSLVILKPSDKDGCRISTANGADPVLPNVASPLTTVLRIMVSQLRLSRLLAFIQCHPFPLSQLPQPGKVPARMRALESSSSSLSRSRQLRTLLEKPCMVHLLKTARPNYHYGEQKANIIFRLMFALTCLVAPGFPRFVGVPTICVGQPGILM